jgi:tripartite-type tricarboxylate transporter receptor subunit TctC
MRKKTVGRVIWAALATASVLAVSVTGVASAQEAKFPTREVRFIVPVSPGGGMDTAARLLAQYWEKHLGGPVVVENIAGAEYNNAIFSLLKAKPDGHTAMIFPGVIANQLLTDVPYDLKDFGWIGRIEESEQIAFASKQSGIKSLEDLKKKQPAKAAVTGLSSSQTIGQLVSAKMMGFDVRPITHKGSTPMVLSVIRGDADWSTNAEIATIPYVQNGDVVPLWVTSEKRMNELPDTPTVRELGYPDVSKVTGFHRIVGANPATPPATLKKLRDSFEKAVKDPGFVEAYSKLGTRPDYLSGEETAELVKEQLDLFRPHVNYLKSFR